MSGDGRVQVQPSRAVSTGRSLVEASVIVAAILGAMWIAYLVASHFGPSAAGIEDLKAEGKTLVDAVERHKARTGKYPETLEAAGVSAPNTRWGRWRYGSDGYSFFVEIGDYSRYQFLLMWDGDKWYLDT